MSMRDKIIEVLEKFALGTINYEADAADAILAAVAEGMEPVAWRAEDATGFMMLFGNIEEGRSYCDDDEEPEPLYTAPPDVKALQARVAELEEEKARIDRYNTHRAAKDQERITDLTEYLSAALAHADAMAKALKVFEAQGSDKTEALSKYESWLAWYRFLLGGSGTDAATDAATQQDMKGDAS